MNETVSTFTDSTQPSHDDISRKAKELWENYGRPSGRDEEIWLEAERALRSPASNPAVEPSKDTTPPPARAATRSPAAAGAAVATPKMPGGRSGKRSA